jgi:hypothetical protein
MIELTPEQRQAVEQGKPVRVIDPSANGPLVVMRADVYERFADLLPPPMHEPPPGIDPLTLRSMQAFWRDLPELLRNKRNKGKWAAYHGDERVGVGKSQTEMYQECFRRGLQRGEFYVGRIDTDDTPPWGPTQGDWSLYEFRDAGEPPPEDS